MPALKLIWFLWTLVLSGACANALPTPRSPVAAALVVRESITYDAANQANAAYDDRSKRIFYYDEASMLAGNERGIRQARAFAHFVKSVAAKGTTALSPYRVTTAGETFSHYGYAENAASFQGGLRPGGFATSSGNLSGLEAQSGLALPRAVPPNAVYTVTPEAGTWIRANPVTRPQFGQPGGLPEYQFPGGTGPGTVSPPRPIP